MTGAPFGRLVKEEDEATFPLYYFPACFLSFTALSLPFFWFFQVSLPPPPPYCQLLSAPSTPSCLSHLFPPHNLGIVHIFSVLIIKIICSHCGNSRNNHSQSRQTEKAITKICIYYLFNFSLHKSNFTSFSSYNVKIFYFICFYLIVKIIMFTL